MSDLEQKGKETVARAAHQYILDFYERKKLEFESRPMVFGVGSGSTVAIFMAGLGELIGPMLAEKKIPYILCVPTSFQAEALIIEHSHYNGKQIFQLCSLNAHPVVDLIVDGADEVHINQADICMLKGGGGAMVMEKIVAAASERRLYLVNKSKVSNIGLGEKAVPVPIEVLPDAYRFVLNELSKMVLGGFSATVRQAPSGKAGPVITDNGNMIIDLKAPGPFDPAILSSVLSEIPGIVGHGIFSLSIDALYIAEDDSLVKWSPLS